MRMDKRVAERNKPINSRSRPYTAINNDPIFPAISKIATPMSGLKITGSKTGWATVSLTDLYGENVRPNRVFVQTYAQ